MLRGLVPALALYMLAVSALSAEHQGARSVDDPVVVQLDETEITRDQLNRRFHVALHLLARSRGVSASQQSQEVLEQLREQYLAKRATELVLLEEAARRAVKISAREVDAVLNSMFPASGEQQEFIDALEDRVPDAESQLRQIVRDEETLRRLNEHMLQEIVVPAGDIITFHHDNKDQLKMPEQACVRHIQLDSRDEALQVLEELNRGAEFEELAAERSVDADSAGAGGDLGCFEKHEASSRTAFESAVFEVPEPGLRGITESQLGYHVLDVYRYRQSRTPTLNEAYEQVERELALEELPNRISALMQESGVETFPDRLGKQEKPE